MKDQLSVNLNSLSSALKTARKANPPLFVVLERGSDKISLSGLLILHANTGSPEIYVRKMIDSVLVEVSSADNIYLTDEVPNA